MELISLILQYAVAPLAGVAWFMFKKQEMRIDSLEKRANDIEIAMMRIETMMQYIGRDIKDIKEDLDRFINKG